jgi:tRNA(Ile)-lysidine synthetase-like protein
MSQTISTFWRLHPKYWIALGDTQAKADKEIYDKFYNVKLDDHDWIDQVIYLDQFTRHFQRAAPDTYKISEDDVGLARVRATQLVNSNIELLSELDEFELVFCLMPFKHVGDFEFVFSTIHERWLVRHHEPLRTYPLLWKFYADSYTKYYSQPEIIDIGIVYDSKGICDYNPDRICDSHPYLYSAADWATGDPPKCAAPLIKALKEHIQELKTPTPLIVSLSGGVDSMVMCYLLRRVGIPIVAVHIIYGNRVVSEEEFAFLRTYCRRLDVPLYAYRVEWLQRADAEREFYEEMTRRIRFAVYRSVGGSDAHVALGHIQDDIVENIWSNLAHATHLTNLTKMSARETMEGVHIHRPWLSVIKSAVYAVSEAAGIPYLKNTTPSWSNRGKFRETFYAATHAQFGPSVDDKLLESARALAAQSDLVERLLYKPVYDSWNETRMLDITRAVEAGLDSEGWSQIFTTICHSKLCISKPSIHACRDFSVRVRRGGVESQRIPMKKDLTVVYHPDGERKVLEFISIKKNE